MKLLIAGASGLIGKHLIAHFSSQGYTIIALSRSSRNIVNTGSKIKWKLWQDIDASGWQDDLEDCDAVINLVGESIAGKRWTEKRKEQLRVSRVNACKLLTKAINETRNRPRVYIQASAIGIYTQGQEQITEDDGEKGGGFLADLTVDWEKSSERIEQFGINRILLRIGIVLSKDSLIISKFKLPFKLFAGGHLADGSQIMSWIHMDDLVNAVEFILKNSRESHIYNLTAPNPVSMKDFCKAFGRAIRRPSWLHVPAFALKLLFGKEMAEQTMLAGDEVLPVNLQKMEFNFQYVEIEAALNSII